MEGGSYFMNRRPIVVKPWSTDFDLYDEVLEEFSSMG